MDRKREFSPKDLKQAQDLLDAIKKKHRRYFKKIAKDAPLDDLVKEKVLKHSSPLELVANFAASTWLGDWLTGYGSSIIRKPSSIIFEAAQQEMQRWETQKYAADKSSTPQQSSSLGKTRETRTSHVTTNTTTVLDPKITGSLRGSHSSKATKDLDKGDGIVVEDIALKVIDKTTKSTSSDEVARYLDTKPSEQTLTQWLARNAYSLLLFTTIAHPKYGRAAMFGIGAGAVALASDDAVDKNYDTTVYCGSKISSCQDDSFDKFGVRVIDVSAGNTALEQHTSVERLILNVHGAQGLVNAMDGLILPPQFTNLYFPNLKILHVLSCQAGALDHKYGSDLKKGQIAFIHADSLSIEMAMLEQITSNLISPKPNQFSFFNPLSIIHKTKSGSSILGRIEQLSIAEIQKVLSDDESQDQGTFAYLKQKLFSSTPDVRHEVAGGIVLSKNQEDKITRLYDIITNHVKKNIDKIMDRFSSAAEKHKKIIAFELSRLGYKEFEKDVSLAEKIDFISFTLSSIATKKMMLRLWSF